MTDLKRPAWIADLHWEQRPADISHRDVAGVAVDASDQVYLFTRFDHQVLVYTSAGKFVRAWGAGIFTNAHSIRIGPDGAVYCVDNGDHSVRKFTPDGELLLTLGVPGTGSDTGYRADLPVRIHNVETVARPAGPFNGCTDIAIGARRRHLRLRWLRELPHPSFQRVGDAAEQLGRGRLRARRVPDTAWHLPAP